LPSRGETPDRKTVMNDSRGLEGLTVQLLQRSASETYNAFLLRGVREHPDTLRIAEIDILTAPFGTRPTAEVAVFALNDGDGAWHGTVAVERERGRAKRSHIAWLLRMYVPRECAGRGVGAALVVHAIEHARTLAGVEKLNLTVAAHNERAVALYQRRGFIEFAREPDAFRDSAPRVELSMSLRL
jgi:GNAT superfamily N-acetyltransferase